mgnify:CR=1 FL=1
MASRNTFVSNKIDKIAIDEIIFTPTVSFAKMRSGKEGPIATRLNVMAMAIPKKISEMVKMVSIITVTPPDSLFQTF